MSVTVELSDFLETNGYGTNDPPTPTIFRFVTPAKPDNVIIVSENPGPDPEWVMGGLDHEVINVTTIVRNLSAATAESIARSIWILIRMKADFVLDTTRYLSIMARSSPFPAGRDEYGRFNWSCNYLVRRREA